MLSLSIYGVKSSSHFERRPFQSGDIMITSAASPAASAASSFWSTLSAGSQISLTFTSGYNFWNTFVASFRAFSSSPPPQPIIVISPEILSPSSLFSLSLLSVLLLSLEQAVIRNNNKLANNSAKSFFILFSLLYHLFPRVPNMSYSSILLFLQTLVPNRLLIYNRTMYFKSFLKRE